MKNDTNTNPMDLSNNPAVREIEKKQVKQYMMIFWICLGCFAVALIGTIILNKKVKNQDLEGIKKVQVCVVNVTEKDIRVNGKSSGTTCEVTVEYMGKEYELIDGGHSPWTYEGHIGTAYMYEGKIYANENGPATRTGAGTIYSVFLIATIVLFIVTPCVGATALQRRNKLSKQA